MRIFLSSPELSTSQVTPQVEQLLKALDGIFSRSELQEKLGLLDREHFRKTYLQPAIDIGFVGLFIPEKPTSSNQKYYLTEKGKEFIQG